MHFLVGIKVIDDFKKRAISRGGAQGGCRGGLLLQNFYITPNAQLSDKSFEGSYKKMLYGEN